MATEQEKKKQGMRQSYEGFNTPGPQAAANQALGNVATGAKDMAGKMVASHQSLANTVANKGPGMIEKAKNIGGSIKQGYDNFFNKASEISQGALDKSSAKMDLGNRLTKAAPILGGPALGVKDAAKGMYALHGKALDVTKKIQPAVYAGKAMLGIKDTLTKDYNKNEVAFGRADPSILEQPTGEVGAAELGVGAGVEAGAEGTGGSNTRIRNEGAKRPRLNLSGDGITVNTADGSRPATPQEIESFRGRAQDDINAGNIAGVGPQAGQPGQSQVHQVGNMDVQFDGSVSPEAQERFLNVNAGGDQVTRMRSGMGPTTPYPRVTGPNAYGAQEEQGPQYVTRETHPDITGEAATAINRAIAQGHQARQSLGVTGENQLNQEGARGLNNLNMAKQYGLNSLANTQLSGSMDEGTRLAQEQLKGQAALAVEQYKQKNAEQFEFIPPEHDKKGNQLPGTGMHVPKNPYDLGDVDPKDVKLEQLIKLDYLQEFDQPAYDRIMAKYGLTE